MEPDIKVIHHFFIVKKTFYEYNIPFSSTSNIYDSLCVACHNNKTHKFSFSTSLHKATHPLEFVNSDIWVYSRIDINITFILQVISLLLHGFIF